MRLSYQSSSAEIQYGVSPEDLKMSVIHNERLTLLLILLFIWICGSSTTKAAEEATLPSDEPAEPPPKGKSFLLFGDFFKKMRERWSGQQQPIAPIYAGPLFPLVGYQNCPGYGGCNPSWNYRPVPYEVHNIYYTNAPAAPLVSSYPSSLVQPQQQQQQQQSNVLILHAGANGQMNSYPQPIPYPTYPQFMPSQQHPPPNLPSGGQQPHPVYIQPNLPTDGQQHHTAYVPNNYGNYPPVVYGTSPAPSYGPIAPNYLPIHGGVAYHRPDTAISVATSSGSAACNPHYACNVG